MVIKKILNNNVIITCDKENEEIIVMGKGIAFNKKVGNKVPDDMIDKVYKLSNQDTSNKFQELIRNIPIEYMELSNKIISYASDVLDKKLNDTIYISMTDHIYAAVERFKTGFTIKNALLWETRRFYKKEMEIGLKALDMIEETCSVRLPDDEAAFIAWHLVNAQTEEAGEDVYSITKVIQEVTNIVKYYFGITFNEDSVYYYRFVTHLKFFAERLLNGKILCGDDDDDIIETIKVKYKNAYSCVEKIREFIEQKYNYDISGEEMLYLTIHVEKMLRKADE